MNGVKTAPDPIGPDGKPIVINEGGYSSANSNRCQAEWYEIACMYARDASEAGMAGIHRFYALQAGYRRDQESVERGLAIALAHRIGKQLESHPRIYALARSAWHRCRALRFR